MDIITAAQNAKLLSPAMAQLSGEQKNAALKEIAHALKANAQKIFDANAQDLEQAQKQRLAAPIIKRLTFNQRHRFRTIAYHTAKPRPQSASQNDCLHTVLPFCLLFPTQFLLFLY